MPGARQQLRGRRLPASGGRIAINDALCLEPVGRQRLAKADKTALAAKRTARPGDDRYPAAPALDQMVDGTRRSCLVVGDNRPGDLVGRLAVDEHHGAVGRQRLVQGGVGQPRAADDDPVDPMPQQRFDEFFLPLAVLDDIRQKQVVAGSTRGILGSPDDFGKERIGDVGNEKADGLRSIGPQSARKGIGPVIEFARR